MKKIFSNWATDSGELVKAVRYGRDEVVAEVVGHNGVSKGNAIFDEKASLKEVNGVVTESEAIAFQSHVESFLER